MCCGAWVRSQGSCNGRRDPLNGNGVVSRTLIRMEELMKHISASGLVLLATVLLGCGSDPEQEAFPSGISFPHTVTIKAERALVAATGEILPNPDFLRGDLVLSLIHI